MSKDQVDLPPRKEKLAVEVLVEGIKELSKGFKMLNQAGMPKSMIKAWIHQKTKLSMKNIDLFLDAMEELQHEMLSPI